MAKPMDNKLLKRLALVVGAILVLANCNIILQSLGSYAYYKDFAYDYISAKAVLNRDDPYLNADLLTRRYLPESPVTTPDHSSSHTPLSILLVTPLAALLSYRQAAIAWCLVELGVLLLSACVFWRMVYARSGSPLWGLTTLTSFLFLGWGPVREELGNGQWTLILLFLLLACWLALRSGRFVAGGLALGAALSIKLCGGPILIYLAIEKKWRTVLAALFTMVIGNAAAALAIGWPAVMNYYLNVGASVSYHYRTAGHNFAIWTLGWRVFEGSLTQTSFGFSASPLFDHPQFAKPFSLVVWLTVLFVGLALAKQLKDQERSVGIMIYLTILLNPVTWTYHIPMAALPLWMTFSALKQLSFPRRETMLSIILFTIPSLPFSTIFAVQRSLGALDDSTPSGVRIPFSAGMLSLAPAAALLGLIAMLYWLTRLQERNNEARTTPPTHKSAHSLLSIFRSEPSTGYKK